MRLSGVLMQKSSFMKMTFMNFVLFVLKQIVSEKLQTAVCDQSQTLIPNSLTQWQTVACMIAVGWF